MRSQNGDSATATAARKRMGASLPKKTRRKGWKPDGQRRMFRLSSVANWALKELVASLYQNAPGRVSCADRVQRTVNAAILAAHNATLAHGCLPDLFLVHEPKPHLIIGPATQERREHAASQTGENVNAQSPTSRRNGFLRLVKGGRCAPCTSHTNREG